MVHEYFSEFHCGGEWYTLSKDQMNNLLNNEWRKEHNLHTSDKECIYTNIQQEGEECIQHFQSLIKRLRNVLYFEYLNKDIGTPS